LSYSHVNIYFYIKINILSLKTKLILHIKNKLTSYCICWCLTHTQKVGYYFIWSWEM